MNADRWEDVAAIFAEVMRAEPVERELLIAEHCGSDLDLALELRSLIDAAEREGPADDLHQRVLSPMLAAVSGEPVPGSRVGPYRIVRELGSGGMGTVYLAERDDPALRQTVALKLVRSGLATELRRRFLHERQIVAGLQHANIARLLDGGVTADGQPYFAMELVEGEPLDRYCDARRLDVRRRLELFLDVCSAVSYAHRNLVVHRDLKPANVLVTSEGQVKLLDFGIAKLLASAEDDGSHRTLTGARLLTPSYASPEQIRGEPIGTASDVYSLGVILYELLTGRRPYRASATLRHELEQAICTEEPERASAALRRTTGGLDSRSALEIAEARGEDVRRLRRRLAGDLDNILRRSLEKDPAARYTSVDAFADDIRRHLAGHPVVARSHTLAYRAGTFVRRNRVLVAAAVIAAISLLGGSAAALWQAREARAQARAVASERDRARLEAEKATQVSEFLAGLFRASSPEEAQGVTLTAHDLLQRGAARVDGELGSQPEVRATMLDVIGRAYRELGDYARARPLLEEALRVRAAGGAERLEYADALASMAALEAYTGRLGVAESLTTEALGLRRRFLPATDPRVAESLENLGALIHQRGDLPRAEPMLREALSLRADSASDPAHAVRTMIQLAHLLKEKGELDEAQALLLHAIEAQRQTYGNDHPQLALALNNFATLLYERSAFDSAEAPLREALAIRRRVLGDAHPEVARTMNNLAALREKQGFLPEAEAIYRESLELKRRTLPPGHASIAINLNNLGLMVKGMGRLAEAESLYREGLAIRRNSVGSDHPLTATSAANLGLLLAETGRYQEAAALHREALAIRQKRLPATHWLVGNSEVDLGVTLSLIGRRAEADALLASGLARLAAARGEEDRYTRRAREHLAEHRMHGMVRIERPVQAAHR